MTEPARPAAHSCGGCDTRWSGSRIAHCPACHRTFTTPAAFDAHRAGSKDRTFTVGKCSDPAARGLVANDRGQWGKPNDGGYIFGGAA